MPILSLCKILIFCSLQIFSTNIWHKVYLNIYFSKRRLECNWRSANTCRVSESVSKRSSMRVNGWGNFAERTPGFPKMWRLP